MTARKPSLDFQKCEPNEKTLMCIRTYMCRDVSASEWQFPTDRLLDVEDASSFARPSHTVWSIGGKKMSCGKCGKKTKKKATKKKAKKKK